jgi:hypothetical protein
MRHGDPDAGGVIPDVLDARGSRGLDRNRQEPDGPRQTVGEQVAWCVVDEALGFLATALLQYQKGAEVRVSQALGIVDDLLENDVDRVLCQNIARDRVQMTQRRELTLLSG